MMINKQIEHYKPVRFKTGYFNGNSIEGRFYVRNSHCCSVIDIVALSKIYLN